jgi:hypothetical protein
MGDVREFAFEKEHAPRYSTKYIGGGPIEGALVKSIVPIDIS